MATVSKWTPFGVALDITATSAAVTRISATQYTVKINVSWETYYSGAQTNYGMTATSGGATATISAFNGTKRSSGSGTLTGTYSISGNGSASKTVSVTFKNFNTDNGDSATKAVSFTVTVPAWTSYNITYNANGGSGAPGAQTKWKDQTLNLSTTKPTRTGYSFLGWSTSSTATSATYAPGGNYTANSAATFYAVWKANTYTVSYNANGGTGAPASQTKTYNKTLTLSSTKPTRANYTFKGWGTSASATTATYAAGGSYTNNAGATLYAVWELSYVKPKISSFTAERCNSAGTADDEGTYGLIKFSWTTTYSVSKVLIEWESGSGGSGSKTISASGTSDSVNTVIGDGTLTTEATYTIRVTVSDSGGSVYATKSISGLKFAIDIRNGGTGVSFGKPAEKADYADFAYSTYHRKNMELENNVVAKGTRPDGTLVEVINFQNANGNFVLGYGNYDNKQGSTNIYGYDVLFGISNQATPGTYRPYLRRGDSITVTFRGSGYVTNAKKDVSFWLPLTAPVIGSPTITATSGNGFIFRQGDKYTHGSSANIHITPTSYEVINYYRCGLYIKAVFEDVTNVTNNDAIGIYWNGTITLS